ncbi:MAG: HAD family hydrolase, partial [Promethearchaeota archaeon]
TLRHNRKNLFWELEQFHLLNYFKEVLYDSRSLKDKSPLIFKYLKKAVKSEKMVLIGDSEADLTAGKNLGLITIAFTDGIRSKEVLSGLEPDFFVDHLSQVLDLLERM